MNRDGSGGARTWRRQQRLEGVVDPVQDATLYECPALGPAGKTQPSRRFRRCVLITHFRTPMSIAISLMATSSRCCCRRAKLMLASCRPRQARADQSSLHLHPWLWTSSRRGHKITPDGLPVLLIKNAPPEIKSPAFQLTRPEIYLARESGSRLCSHRARRVRLSFRRSEQVFDLSGHRRIPG